MPSPKLKRTTYTTQVLEFLRSRDDFLTRPQIRDALRLANDQVVATLIYLRKCKAVDCIIEPDGVAWWFATPDSDQRTRPLGEIKAEPIRRKRPAGAYAPRTVLMADGKRQVFIDNIRQMHAYKPQDGDVVMLTATLSVPTKLATRSGIHIVYN